MSVNVLSSALQAEPKPMAAISASLAALELQLGRERRADRPIRGCGAIVVVSAALAVGSEPETRPDDRGARASRFLALGTPDFADSRADKCPPPPTFGPTPSYGVGYAEQKFCVTPSMVVAQAVCLACRPNGFVEQPTI